jgi:phosphoribosylformimino-5-aminoimidazole carboxamide ribotide isomerase
MEIIPVIYVLDGQCAALYKGDYGQKKNYRGTPLEWAERFIREGAEKIYLSDLNARKNGRFVQKDLFTELIGQISVPVMLEASFPDMSSIQEALNLGAAQIVLRSPTYEFAGKAIETFGAEKIIVQIFAKRAELIENREKKNADDFTDVVDYAEKLVPLGVKYVIYKDRRSEGILTHPNYDEIDRLFLTCGGDLKIYSSGGISEIHHLKLLKKIGAHGALIGKAFFERTIGVREAVESVGR